MRASALVLVVGLGGCDQLFNIDHVNYTPDKPLPDAPEVRLIDAPTMCNGTLVGQAGAGGTGLVRVCVPQTVTADVTLPSMLDTSSDCDTTIGIDAVTDACVKWARNMTVPAMRVTGSRPLVVVALQSISVTGVVDVASHITGKLGPGSNPSTCPVPDGPNGVNGGAGGAGGTFGTLGGNGGANASGDHGEGDDAVPGDRVRGGCSGGKGGEGATSIITGGDGGAGGGAIYLAAGQQLAIAATAVINASGAGGHGGGKSYSTYPSGGGGGGGGAGGLIGLDAPLIVIDPMATLVANGGGGGAGGTTTPGSSGSDTDVTMITRAAAGGAGTPFGGGGGVLVAPGSVGGSSKSSGGGGGGVGYVRIFSPAPATPAQSSPPPT